MVIQACQGWKTTLPVAHHRPMGSAGLSLMISGHARMILGHATTISDTVTTRYGSMLEDSFHMVAQYYRYRVGTACAVCIQSTGA